MRLYWGPILAGVVAGFIAASVTGLVVTGFLSDGGLQQALLVFVSFLAELAAGFVAGRLSPVAAAFNGSQAALLLYLVASVVALTNGAALPVLVLGAALALVIGTLGGVLATAAAGGPST